jgi:hypothetical protein
MNDDHSAVLYELKQAGAEATLILRTSVRMEGRTWKPILLMRWFARWQDRTFFEAWGRQFSAYLTSHAQARKRALCARACQIGERAEERAVITTAA